MADDKNSLSQMIESVRETIKQKWEDFHVASPAQRKALRAEISSAVSGLGKTIKQYDPRRTKVKNKKAAKKISAAKRKAAPKKSAAKRKEPTVKASARKAQVSKR